VQGLEHFHRATGVRLRRWQVIARPVIRQRARR
jgi:hypothetical protein